MGTILTTATRFLPAILAGLVAGTADQDDKGSGMIWGRANLPVVAIGCRGRDT